MDKEEGAWIRGVLMRCGAVLEGHFLYTSGRHGNLFIQMSRVLQYPEHAGALCRMMAGLWSDVNIDTVVGPAMGGIVIAYETARALGARALFTERDEGKMRLLRGFGLEPGERVLVVDDVMTTGGSLRDSMTAVRTAGGLVVGMSVLVHRNSGTALMFDVLYRPLTEIEAVSYPPDKCPLCAQNAPIIDPDKLTAAGSSLEKRRTG